MECPKPSAVSALIILVHVMMAAEPGIVVALKLEPAGTSTHIPPLLDCAHPAPAAPSSAFRDNLLALLGGGDRVFARAFCDGFGSSPSASDCLSCLSAAAQDVADRCHGRRGAVWRASCFLSYADTNACTPREDAWRGWFYDDDSADGTASAACMANITAAVCSRCLNESAQVVPALKERRRLSLLHRNSVVVVGYSCYLRVPLSPKTTGWLEFVFFGAFVFDVVGVLLILVGGLLCCIRIANAAA